MKLLLGSQVREFFRNMLDEWLGRRHVRLSNQAHDHVADMLTRPAVDPQAAEHLLKEPLGRLYLEASLAQARARVAMLRRIGDNSLLLSGWWREHFLELSASADAGYYIALGQRAYGSIHDPLFDELAQKFEALTDVLMRMELQCALQDPDQTLRLYALWLRTREAAIADSLLARGFVLTETEKTRPS